MKAHRILRSFALLGAAPWISACGLFGSKEEPPPPPPAPTMVEMRIATSKDVNPAVDGSGAPVLIRVYELKGPVNFKNADFFALYEKEDGALGGDLVRKSELFMKPGESRTLDFKAEDATQFVGVFAAFRKLDNAQWRALATIPPHQTTIVDVKITGTQLNVQSTQKAEAKPGQANE